MKLSPMEVSQLAQMACLLEASTSKPGNVSPEQDFTDMNYNDFLFSAAAIGGPVYMSREMATGEAILSAVKETQKYVRVNTNLGIILLIIPLAQAYHNMTRRIDPICLRDNQINGLLREELSSLLKQLTQQDASNVYQAIRTASAGGMGKVDEGDIEAEPEIPLLKAMELARDRDSIAREYVTGFEITFTTGYPILRGSIEQGIGIKKAVAQAFLGILSAYPDTLIFRKTDQMTAERISKKAEEIVRAGGVITARGRYLTDKLNNYLISDGNRLNPGTTADLTTASLFLLLLLHFREIFGQD